MEGRFGDDQEEWDYVFASIVKLFSKWGVKEQIAVGAKACSDGTRHCCETRLCWKFTKLLLIIHNP